MTSARDRAELEGLYDRIWSNGREALEKGTLLIDPLPRAGDTRWGISAIFRVTPWPAHLLALGAELRALMGPDGVVYHPHNAHATVVQFESYRTEVAPDDPRVAIYIAALCEVAASQAPIEFEFSGLSASPGGVLLRGFASDALQSLRAALHLAVRSRGLQGDGPEHGGQRLRVSAHATLAIYGDQITDSPGMSRLIEAHHRTDFMRLRCSELVLAGYRRTRETVDLIEYARVELSK